ncbi:MAG: cation transporter [Gemmatimonadaceae bacterium]|nr:cation transporter [Gemmatimonadaceae bacterium]
MRFALFITATFLIAEVVGGIVSNSLALLADAGHMLTDVGALGLSLFVAWFSRQAASPQKTYGYLRWEILAALLNGAALLVISIWICVEAVLRFRTPEPIGTGVMLTVAVAGLLVNVAAAWALHGSHQHNMNVRGAYLHVLGDLLASVATITAAVVIQTTGWLQADPVASVLSTMLIVRGAWRLVSEAVDVLLEATPSHIAIDDVRARLSAVAHVESVHDLHVWTVTSGIIAMSAHAIVREAEQHQQVLEAIHDAMRDMDIGHVTVQLERSEMYDRELHLHP